MLFHHKNQILFLRKLQSVTNPRAEKQAHSILHYHRFHLWIPTPCGGREICGPGLFTNYTSVGSKLGIHNCTEQSARLKRMAAQTQPSPRLTPYLRLSLQKSTRGKWACCWAGMPAPRWKIQALAFSLTFCLPPSPKPFKPLTSVNLKLSSSVLYIDAPAADGHFSTQFLTYEAGMCHTQPCCGGHCLWPHSFHWLITFLLPCWINCSLKSLLNYNVAHHWTKKLLCVQTSREMEPLEG